jgi:multidrug efflux pump
MRAFTDLFIRRPVLAIVVSVIILIAGLHAWSSLSVRQYPRSDNASVTVATTYVGASAEVVRGFVTTAIERAIASADGIDYVESKSLLGLSLVTARLKLNYDATKALADITAKVNQVRNELPPEAEVPSISVQSADSEFAAAYLSFSSTTLSQSEITDYLVRSVQPRLAALTGVQRADVFGGRTFAMRVWLQPDRMAALNVSPAEVRTALAANNYLAAVGSTKARWYRSISPPTRTCTRRRSSSSSSSVSRTTRSCACATLRRWSWAPRTTTRKCASTARPPCSWASSRCRAPTRSTS